MTSPAPTFRIVDGVCTCNTCHAIVPRGAQTWRARAAHRCTGITAHQKGTHA